MRARRREMAEVPPAPLMFERQDWTLFLDRATLPQHAGCQPNELGRVVLKELVDNALDTGANVTLDRADRGDDVIGYVIADDGPGIDPAEIPRLFAVNRPLLSSKLKRLPLRGMLGHGLRVVMGAVASLGGHISVASRGHRLTLAVDLVTGITRVLLDEPIPQAPGTAVAIALTDFNGGEARPAKLTVAIAREGQHYTGPSLPNWHGVRGLQQLLHTVMPESTTVADVVNEVFGLVVDDSRPARSLSRDDLAELHHQLCQSAPGASPISDTSALLRISAIITPASEGQPELRAQTPRTASSVGHRARPRSAATGRRSSTGSCSTARPASPGSPAIQAPTGSR